MMKKILILCLLVFIYIPLTAQINKNGIPLIRNYSPNDYNAAEQNWAICEDKRGVIYVGNNDDGVLEFDGNSWKKIPISNGSIVRSLASAEDGTVYVGGIDEFGYLAPDKRGEMHYHTLKDQLDSVILEDIYKIYTINNEIYFCEKHMIFKFVDKKFSNVYKNTGQSFLSFLVGDKIYWGSYDKGLYELTEDTIQYTNGGDFYKEKDIFVMLPWSENEIFIATIGQGLYIY
ncbi:MAG: hypothetical protein KAQ75_15340, partial [Bacteroidales bacterium]|nr:hypothetical protein [Bacteroidales bacterium]